MHKKDSCVILSILVNCLWEIMLSRAECQLVHASLMEAGKTVCVCVCECACV